MENNHKNPPARTHMPPTRQMQEGRTDRALRDAEVAELLGVHRTSVWRLARTRPGFPRPYKVGQRAIRWLESEVLAYIERCRA